MPGHHGKHDKDKHHKSSKKGRHHKSGGGDRNHGEAPLPGAPFQYPQYQVQGSPVAPLTQDSSGVSVTSYFNLPTPSTFDLEHGYPPYHHTSAPTQGVQQEEDEDEEAQHPNYLAAGPSSGGAPFGYNSTPYPPQVNQAAPYTIQQPHPTLMTNQRQQAAQAMGYTVGGGYGHGQYPQYPPSQQQFHDDDAYAASPPTGHGHGHGGGNEDWNMVRKKADKHHVWVERR